MEPLTNLFTKNKDIDRQILLRAKDEQLFAACQADTYAASLCNNYFWSLRFEREFRVNLDHYSKKVTIKQGTEYIVKDEPLNYRKLYFQFSKLKNDPNKFLLRAIEYGFIELVIWAITPPFGGEGADVTSDFYSTVKKAASYDSLNVLELLLEYVPDDDYKEVIDDSLIFAAGNNNFNIVNYLLQQGADIHYENEHALQTAVYEGLFVMVKYLLSKGANLYNPHVHFLDIAAKSNNVNILEFLLKKGLDIQVDNDRALIEAAKNGSLEAFKYLIANGADITADYYQAMTWTIAEGHINILDYIIKELNIVPKYFDLFENIGIAIDNNQIEMIKYLLKNELIDDGTIYNLTMRTMFDKNEITKLLLGYMNEYYKKLLVHEIIQKYTIEELKFLDENGVNVIDDEFLKSAARFKNYKKIRFLLDQGNDINSLDDYLDDEEIRKIYKEYGVEPIELFKKILKKENILFLRNMLDKRGLPSGGTRVELIDQIVNNPTKAEIKKYGLESKSKKIIPIKEKKIETIEKSIKNLVGKECKQCVAITKKGTQCQNCAKPGSKYCGIHAKK